MYKYIFIITILFYGCLGSLSMSQKVTEIKRHVTGCTDETNDLENLIGTPLQKCLNCICFASTNWTNAYVCDSRFISERYWQNAGSPSVNKTMEGNVAYEACMNNENCFLNTINQYIEEFGQKDCNKNGKFDCVDRFYLQSYNRECVDLTYAPYFYNCIAELPEYDEL